MQYFNDKNLNTIRIHFAFHFLINILDVFYNCLYFFRHVISSYLKYLSFFKTIYYSFIKLIFIY